MLRIVNFAHGEFLMIAMYGAWAMTRFLGLNPFVAVLAIVPGMFLFGMLVHHLVIRPGLDKPHLVVVFATMGLSILMQNLALMVFSADLFDVPPMLGGRSFSIGPFYAKPELLIGFFVAVACTLALRFLLQATYLGKAIRATVQDGEAAMLMGIPVPRIFLITFAGGSALVGLAACMMTPLFSVFPTVGLNFVLIAFVVVVLGGMGSIEGALIGGICIGVVQSICELLCRARLRADVLLHPVPAGDDVPPGRPARTQGRGDARHERLRPPWTPHGREGRCARADWGCCRRAARSRCSSSCCCSRASGSSPSDCRRACRTS